MCIYNIVFVLCWEDDPILKITRTVQGSICLRTLCSDRLIYCSASLDVQ